MAHSLSCSLHYLIYWCIALQYLALFYLILKSRTLGLNCLVSCRRDGSLLMASLAQFEHSNLSTLSHKPFDEC